MEANTQVSKVIPFAFTGNATEYFGIWIVNILLTILTLGFYTPWAKVRTRRYFYGNTVLDNSAFDYLASPVAILKGYILALVLLIIYALVANFYPFAEPVMMLILFICLPWLVVRSMIFRARNSMFRNIRFSFKKAYGEAMAVFVGFSMLIPFTLGLIFPYLIFRQKKFFVENSGFGKTRFNFHAGSGEFYKIYIILGVITGVLFGLLVLLLLPMIQDMLAAMPTEANYAKEPEGELNPGQFVLFQFAILGMFFLIYFVSFGYLEARIGNLVWNNVELATNRFQSCLRARDLVWIYFSNIIAIMLSMGLLIPWAKVRLAKYRASKLAMVSVSGLDHFMKHEMEQAGAAGDEIGDMFDIDVGI